MPISSTWSDGPELERAADAVELRLLGFGERHVRPLEQRAGVHHRLVQHQPEEIVAEIVVRGDVAAAAGAGVAVQPVREAPQWRGQARETALQAVERRAIAQQEPHSAVRSSERQWPSM